MKAMEHGHHSTDKLSLGKISRSDLQTRLKCALQIIRDLFNPESGNGMSYVRIPVSLMSDFMSADGGGEYWEAIQWDLLA